MIPIVQIIYKSEQVRCMDDKTQKTGWTEVKEGWGMGIVGQIIVGHTYKLIYIFLGPRSWSGYRSPSQQ